MDAVARFKGLLPARVHGVPERWHIVVTGVKSRSHLIYVASYLRHILDDAALKEMRVSYIEAPGFLGGAAIEVSTAASFLPDDPRLTLQAGMPEWRFSPGTQATYVSVGTPGLHAWAALRRANPMKRFDVVVTDEGLGTYGSWNTRRAAMVRQGTSPRGAAVRAAILGGSSAVLTSRRWATYEISSSAAKGDTAPSAATGSEAVKPENGWPAKVKLNADVAREFERYFAPQVRPERRLAVILTQPFADMQLISADDQRAYVARISEAARAAGLEPVIRPHPAEDVSLYDGLALMQGRGTAELDPLVQGAGVVIGGPSTALVNVSAVFEVPVIWVSIPHLENLDQDVSTAQRDILQTYLGHPITMAELSGRLRGLALGA